MNDVLILDNETMDPILLSANPMSMSVIDEQRVMSYQVEDGTEMTGHVIRELIEIDLLVRITGSPKEEFNSLLNYYENRKLTAVQTKVRLYESMLIKSIPHPIDADDGDSLLVQILFTEWREATPDYGELPLRQVRSPRHSDTQERGTPAASPTADEPEEQVSILSRIFR